MSVALPREDENSFTILVKCKHCQHKFFQKVETGCFVTTFTPSFCLECNGKELEILYNGRHFLDPEF